MNVRQTCDETGKRMYTSHRQAKLAMATASNKIRVYRCDYCHHLHVTSMAEPQTRSVHHGDGRMVW
jgi:hypothetical protein